MNNKKKLLSIITALAITSSVFTGFAVTASATETPIVSYTFDETSDAAWKISGTNAGVLPMKLYLMMQVPKQNGTASIIKLQQPRQKAAEERQA